MGTSVPQYPAADPCVVAVASVNNDLQKSTWSSYGNWVDMVAPGENVYSTYGDPMNSPTVVDNYGWWSGTSLSTPFVSGQAALIHSFRPQLSVRQIAALIAQTAQSVNAQNPAYVGGLGAGLPKVYSSLEFLAMGNTPALGSGPLSACAVP